MNQLQLIKKKDGFQGQKAIVIPRPLLAQKCAKNNLINTLYITDIGYYPKAQHHYRQRPHGADQHILIYCEKGAGNVSIKETSYRLFAGNFIFIPCKSPHQYDADQKEPWTIYWVHFKGNVSQSLMQMVEKHTENYKGYINNPETVVSLFNDIYHKLERGYGVDNLTYTNMCLWHFLSALVFNQNDKSAQIRNNITSVDLAIDYFNKSIHKTLTLNDIAQKVNLSASHFSSLFKAQTGFSPLEYFNHLKIQKASQYLLFTSLRIKEIAWEVGIQDPYYFSRLFSKVMGIAPNFYREKKGH